MVGRTESQMDTERQHFNLICSTLMQIFSSISQSMKGKSAENFTFPILEGHKEA